MSKKRILPLVLTLILFLSLFNLAFSSPAQAYDGLEDTAIYVDYGSLTIATSYTDWFNVTDTLVTFTITEDDTPVLILFLGTFYMSSTGQKGSVGLFQDNTTLLSGTTAEIRGTQAGDYWNIPLHYIGNFSAGTYTIQPKMKSATGGASITAYGNNINERFLAIIVLPDAHYDTVTTSQQTITNLEGEVQLTGGLIEDFTVQSDTANILALFTGNNEAGGAGGGGIAIKLYANASQISHGSINEVTQSRSTQLNFALKKDVTEGQTYNFTVTGQALPYDHVAYAGARLTVIELPKAYFTSYYIKATVAGTGFTTSWVTIDNSTLTNILQNRTDTANATAPFLYLLGWDNVNSDITSPNQIISRLKYDGIVTGINQTRGTLSGGLSDDIMSKIAYVTNMTNYGIDGYHNITVDAMTTANTISALATEYRGVLYILGDMSQYGLKDLQVRVQDDQGNIISESVQVTHSSTTGNADSSTGYVTFSNLECYGNESLKSVTVTWNDQTVKVANVRLNADPKQQTFTDASLFYESNSDILWAIDESTSTSNKVWDAGNQKLSFTVSHSTGSETLKIKIPVSLGKPEYVELGSIRVSNWSWNSTAYIATIPIIFSSDVNVALLWNPDVGGDTSHPSDSDNGLFDDERPLADIIPDDEYVWLYDQDGDLVWEGYAGDMPNDLPFGWYRYVGESGSTGGFFSLGKGITFEEPNVEDIKKASIFLIPLIIILLIVWFFGVYKKARGMPKLPQFMVIKK